MNKVYFISRLLLGLIFLVFGVNGLVSMTTGSGFIPIPPPSEEMKIFFGGMMAAKYIMPVVKILEVLAGALLLFNKYVNLAITLLGPIIFNILFLHIFIPGEGLPIAILTSIMWLILFLYRFEQFKDFFAKK